MKKRYAALIIAGAVFTAAMAVFPPSMGKMKNKDSYAVCEKTYIDADGAKLGMVIKGRKQGSPVLLLLGGGPGIPEYLLETEYPGGLDDIFTVCMPSYRGTGLSYEKDTDESTMTNEQYLKDAEAVTDYLRERFGQDRIYLMSHSFGTQVGLPLAAAHPEKFEAYIAMGLICDQPRSEQAAYRYMLDKAEGSLKKELEQYGSLFEGEPKEFSADDPLAKKYLSKTRDKAMHRLGVGTTRDMDSVISGLFFPSLRMTEFTPKERINIWRGKVFSDKCAASRLSFRAEDEVQRLEIPFYVFAGKNDRTTDYDLQREYFDFVSADVKGFYTFEDSAHSPVFEQPDLAKKILSADVLKGRTSLSDDA